MPGWPFWAATSDERIELAFDLVRLQPGERLLDIGCGDGRVLLRAAALRGAQVTGIELDAKLAALARALLAEHGVEATIIEADFTTAPIDDEPPDVVFAYLSPSTLQRLRPRLAALPESTRIVTTGYAIPGWQPQVAGGRCYVYFLPPLVEEATTAPGWVSAGVLVAIHPDAPSLVAVKLRPTHAGPIEVAVEGDELAGAMTIRTGADVATDDEVVVDLRFEPLPAGTVLRGALTTNDGDEPPFQVFVVVDEGAPGMWGLSPTLCDRVAAAVAGGHSQLAVVLDEARTAEAE
jgi:SAM-dependent methyltransferase